MNGKIEFLRQVAQAYPGITVVEFNERFYGKTVEVIQRYIALETAEKEQFKEIERNG